MITYKKIAVGFFAVILFILIIFTQSFLGWEKTLQGKFYPHVKIDNQDFGKKTKTDVVDYFNNKNLFLKKISFSILLDNQPIATLSGQQINLHYDGPGLAERAYLIGRSSNTSSRYYQKISSIFFNQSFQISSTIDFDKETAKQTMNNFEESFNKPAKKTKIKICLLS